MVPWFWFPKFVPGYIEVVPGYLGGVLWYPGMVSGTGSILGVQVHLLEAKTNISHCMTISQAAGKKVMASFRKISIKFPDVVELKLIY